MKPDLNRIIVLIAMLFLLLPSASGQEKTVVLKGRVIDSYDGYPLIGVSVIVEGTRNGTSTDVDGNYELRIPDRKCEVTFSYVGYDEEVKLYTMKNASAFSKIVMYMNSTELDDVIVTGVYERKKESFTGASATFKADQLKSVGNNNVLQSLKTLDPSFKMMESTQFGSNPNMMPDIEIRGKTSVVGLKEEYGTDPNQPLFILDGFETTIETIMNLNMNRVASVTILKDAASTAIYGSKASNGVVVIETKAPARGRLQLS